MHDSTELVNHLPELNFDVKFFGYFNEHFVWDRVMVPQPDLEKKNGKNVWEI